MYCGTATRFDFRFSTAAPLTTPAAFDAATPVATVPAPPPGSHDAGGSLVVADARFAGQLVFLAVQVVDDAGNRSPLTAIGSFDFAPAFTLQRASLTRGPRPHTDRLMLRALVPQPVTAFDPAHDALTLTMEDADGTFFTATVPAGSFRANATRTRVAFRDPGGTIAGGLVQVVMVRDRRSGGTRLMARGRGLDLSGADRPAITTSLRLGAALYRSINTFRLSRTRLRFP